MIHSTSRAILILECPWDLDDSDANRSSVLPFIEGIAKYAGDTAVFHANFYDTSSFEQALDYLCKVKFNAAVIYVAAHGYKKKIGNVNISTVLAKIGVRSKKFNISGIMLGSCFVGENTQEIINLMEGTNVKWCAGYSSSPEWLTGTMIDSSIISAMLQLEDEDYQNRDLIIKQFANSIAPFSEYYPIAENYKKNETGLNNSIEFVCQPNGKGSRAKKCTEEVFSAYKNFQSVRANSSCN